MAKKQKKGGKKGKGKSRKSTKGGDFFSVPELIGLAGVAFVNPKLDKIEQFAKLDPKIQGAAKYVLGRMGRNQEMVKKFLSDDEMRNAAGTALSYEGVKQLMTSMNIAGVGKEKRKVRGNEFLAVSIEGIEKADVVNEDVLSDDELGAEDEYDIGDDDDMGADDDISTVNDDELGDDDDMGADEDIDTVNDDVLGDDDEMGETLL